MKWASIWLIASAGCLLCLGVAGWLAIDGKDGWGWFLFVGLLLTPSIERKETK